ncbi:hypothetical protein CDAR_580801 [Caerostris darwini]|uniref:Uncharacterized protein n=1 Tax=Caerostris darwini TaxID=1538125 RepID=A0AAV4RGJ1_9ARAC|nr:hypothetical protein CDAR_580801 [Caerostris darwini]
MKDAYNKKMCGTTTYKSGQAVVMKRTPIPMVESTKTQPKYRGPLITTDVLPGDTYRVTQLGEKSKDILTQLTARQLIHGRIKLTLIERTRQMNVVIFFQTMNLVTLK